MGTSATTGLERLRSATDPLHEQVESRTGLPDSLSSVDDLIGFLRRWVDLASTLEPKAGSLLPDSIIPTISADLVTLGAEPVAHPGGGVAADGGEVGTAWVLLGARLGLKSVAPAVRELSGHDLATFRSVDAAALIDLRHHIDALDDEALDQVIADATTAFAIAGDTLQGPPWS